MKNFSLFLGLRYLKPKRTFVSIITLISIAGVTLAIMVLIVVIAVMTGFDRELQRKVLGFEPHLIVGGGNLLYDWRPVAEKVREAGGVTAVAPFVQGPVIVEARGRLNTPMMRGIQPKEERGIMDLAALVKDGALDLTSDSVVLGRGLADSIGVQVGDTVTIYAPGNIRAIIDELNRENDEGAQARTLADLKSQVVLPAELTVAGIFESGRNDYDAHFLFVTLHLAQELYDLQGAIHGLSVRTGDPYQANAVKQEVGEIFHGAVRAQTWMDLNQERFDAIRIERNVMFIILMFLVVIASFTVMNTLITVTVQKTREIGIMKALGAQVSQIVWVFLAQGMVVGFFGNIAGLGLGLLAIHYRNGFKEWLANTLGIQLFPPGVYEFTQIPAEVIPGDVAIICVSAFVMCSVAALIPAWFAARLEPVKALRAE